MGSAVLCILLLSVLVAAVDGDCNKAIQSLEATLVTILDKKFEQLKAEIKENCCQGNTTDSNFFVILFLFFFLLNRFSVFSCIFFLGQVTHIPRARKFTTITSE